MDPIKKEISKLIFKTAKEAFRRGYRAHKKSKKQHEAYKSKYRRGHDSEGVIPYSKEAIKKSIRSVKFQGRAAKLAKKEKKPAGSKAPTISFVGKGYQGDKTKSMQVPMITKLERREIQKSIGRSVKKFMKEKVGRKAKGGLTQGGRGKGPRKSEEEYYFDFREKMDKKKKRDQWRKDMEKDLEHHRQEKKGVWVSKGGLLIKPKLAKRGF